MLAKTLFCFALTFSFIAVKWPKMANRPNKQPKKTSVYRKFVRFIEYSKMKTLSSICWPSAIAYKYFSFFFLLFCIAFTIRAVTS